MRVVIPVLISLCKVIVQPMDRRNDIELVILRDHDSHPVRPWRCSGSQFNHFRYWKAFHRSTEETTSKAPIIYREFSILAKVLPETQATSESIFKHRNKFDRFSDNSRAFF